MAADAVDRPARRCCWQADTLVYNNDNQTVTAVGGVQIDYGGNQLVAQRVVYNRKTKRLVASGNVEIVNSDGTKIYSDAYRHHRRFRRRLRQCAARRNHRQGLFRRRKRRAHGRHADHLPQWRLYGLRTVRGQARQGADLARQGQKIIWNGEKKTVRFENCDFEFFGFPLAYLPAFEIADPTVKRKSGFLIPSISYKSHLGYSVNVPYYFALRRPTT